MEPGSISVVFQPIVELSGGTPELRSLESLARGPAGTNVALPNVMFDYARLKKVEDAVDRVCVWRALAEARALLPEMPRIAMNVHASTLGRDAKFVEFLVTTARAFLIPLDKLTVEIVEHAPPWDGRSFLRALDALRSHDIRIALDDVGLGQSNYKMMVDVHPDYMKIDRYFVDGCHKDKRRAAVVASVQQLCDQLGCEAIAEGVEDEADVGFASSNGIRLFQGYLFGRPKPLSELFATAGA
jgi:EAL domain-containing protein (putative c-di-GMP-specific phosphodiesterase class I)